MIPTATQNAKFRRLVRRIRELLNCELVSVELVAVGLLERLWHETCANSPAGDIGRLSNEDIAEGVGWFGDCDDLVEILTATGWLDRCKTHRLVVHKWDKYAPNFVKQNNKRWNRQFVYADSMERPMDHPVDRPKEPPLDAPSTGLERPMDVTSSSSTNTSSNTNTNTKKKNVRNNPEDGKDSGLPDSPPDEVILEFPTKRSDQTWYLTRSVLDELCELFPGFTPEEVLSACKKARVWCVDSPRKRKTRDGCHQFLIRWLERARGDPQSSSSSGITPPGGKWL